MTDSKRAGPLKAGRGDVYYSYNAGLSVCRGCKREEELRLGYCFDCASKGEERAAKRTVIGHIKKAWENYRAGSRNWRYDLKWAWERATRTGDYKRNGYFDREGINWRAP